MAEPLNREVLLLVGHPQRERLPALAERLGQAWSREPLFEKVQWQLTPDLPGLRQQLLASRLALAPGQARDELIKTPDAYLQARAAALFDPFAGAAPCHWSRTGSASACCCSASSPRPARCNSTPAAACC